MAADKQTVTGEERSSSSDFNGEEIKLREKLQQVSRTQKAGGGGGGKRGSCKSHSVSVLPEARLIDLTLTQRERKRVKTGMRRTKTEATHA